MQRVDSHRAGPRSTPVVVRRLLRSCRMFEQLHHFEDATLRWKLWRRLCAHCRYFCALDTPQRWFVEDWYSTVQAWLRLEQDRAAARALDRHVARVGESPQAQRRWFRSAWHEQLDPQQRLSYML